METFILILMVGALIFIIATAGPKPNNIANQIVVQRKQCPPHQWFWQEVVDQHGVKQGERIVCKVCGPINSNVGDGGEV